MADFKHQDLANGWDFEKQQQSTAPTSDAASEVTVGQSHASRTNSIASEATSHASGTALLNNGHHANPTLPSQPAQQDRARSNSSPTRWQTLKSSKRESVEDYSSPVIKKYVAETGHKTGTILDATKRREMCAYHRWVPRTDVGKALMEDRDEDAIEGIRTAKKLGSWISRRTEQVVTDLHLAAAFGALKVVNALLEYTNMKSVNNGDLIRQYPFAPHQPIDFAAAGDHVEVVASLIQAGSATDSAYVSPLCFAVQKQAYGVVDLLLEYGSDPLKVCDYGSPLHRACKSNNPILVQALSDVMQKDKKCLVSFQILHPLPIDHPSYFGLGHTSLLHIIVDPLAFAAFHGSLEALETLLAHNVSTEEEYAAEFVSGGKRVSHVTALSLAAARGHDSVVQVLLERNPSQKMKDHAFAAAIYNKQHESAKLISNAGAQSTFVTKAWSKLLGMGGVTKQSGPVEIQAEA